MRSSEPAVSWASSRNLPIDTDIVRDTSNSTPSVTAGIGETTHI